MSGPTVEHGGGEHPGVAVAAHAVVHIYRTEGHDVAALSGVTLTVPAGEVVALLGPSGSGKSTLLQLCAGLLRPAAGRLTVGGEDLARLSPAELDEFRRVTLGMVLQGADTNVVPYLTCADNVRFARPGLSATQVSEALALVGLAGYDDREVTTFGPGDLQLLALAGAVAHRPRLLLADEPTSKLDHASRDIVTEAIFRINAELGTTVLLVTHDPVVAARMPRTVTIRDGRIGAEGRSGEEFAVVSADGSLPLPPDLLADLPPGTLLRVLPEPDGVRLVRAEDDDAATD
ncbi:ABC transporter ATP-binding protein [Nocardioides sambongensis]|uniref:ABC transporter ATP-binding protein n=1 Tax=Nocardioides sambongensis TaxID=2589074 RepID=UPI00112E7A13|nr:ATP-binding cassette domain-containing protein [Nocardioides sambongensis]